MRKAFANSPSPLIKVDMYRFVSDSNFTHTETLSGRVTAACVTCRRRVRIAETRLRDQANISEQKTRCDGGMPCKTCKEKGIACEGFVKRRKPRKRIAEKRMWEAGSPGSRSEASTCSTDLSEIVTPDLSPAEAHNYLLINDSYEPAPQDGVHNSLDPIHFPWPEADDESADWLTQYTCRWPDSAPKVANAPDLLFTASILEEQARTLRQMAMPSPPDDISSMLFGHMGASALPHMHHIPTQEPCCLSYSNTICSTGSRLESCSFKAGPCELLHPQDVYNLNEQVVDLAQSLPLLISSAPLTDQSGGGCTEMDNVSGLGRRSEEWNPEFREMIAQLSAART